VELIRARTRLKPKQACSKGPELAPHLRRDPRRHHLGDRC
jgi:hypothetical protein